MPKSNIKILAIESSCDETAAAVISVEKLDIRNEKNSNNSYLKTNILSNIVSSQIDLHAKFGGVFPEVASRAHAENIVPVVQEALEKAAMRYEKLGKNANYSSLISKNLDLIAVTAGPGLVGSLLIGVNFAKTLAFITKKPILPINHWLGHIYSCFAGGYPLSVVGYQKEKSENGKLETENKLPQFPLLALIVSGGHTGLVLMKSHTEIIPLGETLDDAAGEAFDKVAKLLGLGYPGGPAISVEAEKMKHEASSMKHGIENHIPDSMLHTTISFPRSMLKSNDYNFSFSGLKTAVLYKVQELEKKSPDGVLPNYYKSLVAYEFQQTVIDILIGKTLQAAKQFKPKSIVLCGGVAANKELRTQMQKAIEMKNEASSMEHGAENHTPVSFHVPPMSLAGDNAAMIAIAAAYRPQSQWTTFDKVNVDSNMKL